MWAERNPFEICFQPIEFLPVNSNKISVLYCDPIKKSAIKIRNEHNPRRLRFPLDPSLTTFEHEAPYYSQNNAAYPQHTLPIHFWLFCNVPLFIIDLLICGLWFVRICCALRGQMFEICGKVDLRFGGFARLWTFRKRSRWKMPTNRLYYSWTLEV